MNKANILTFRLPGAVYKELSRRAEAEGYTISDLARRIIMEHTRVEDLLQAVKDTRKSLSQEIMQLKEELGKMRTITGADKPETESFAAYKSRIGR